MFFKVKIFDLEIIGRFIVRFIVRERHLQKDSLFEQPFLFSLVLFPCNFDIGFGNVNFVNAFSI